MSVSLSEQRDRVQRQVDELERLSVCVSAAHPDIQLLSSETDDESGSDDTEDKCPADLLAQRQQIQKEIEKLEDKLGPQRPVSLSDDSDIISSSDESELGLPPSVDSCLQVNLVYQQVVQETLSQLETLLTHNHRQQAELVSQLSGPIREPPREQPALSSYQLPINMYLGRFLKPYFKDKQTGLGPPANQETKEKCSRMTGCLDENKVKIKRWESWQKTLLIHSVSRDSLRRLVQPKLSRVDYLTQKLSSAAETDRPQLREQIHSLEREMDKFRAKKEEELIGDRYEEHDWEKISNIDFEGTREAEDIRCFWQNFLHPSIRKVAWTQEEVEHLRDISRRHRERHWKKIAEELGTERTAFMCLQTFQRFVSDSLRRGAWTPDEDALLRELVDKMRIGNFIPYTQMSYFMAGRGPPQLIYRWTQVLDPSLKKGPWTKQEDQLLLRAVSSHGEKNWWKIRLEVPGRTDSACRDRYHDCLKAGMRRGAFDEQEQELLLQLVEKYGVGRWSKIAAEIPQRFDAQCLREWKKLSRKRLRPPQKMPKSRRKIKKKEKEELSSEEELDEKEVVEYMNSDDDEQKMKEEEVPVQRPAEEEVPVQRPAEEEVAAQRPAEEEVEEYTCPPMAAWTPDDRAERFSFLSFSLVSFPVSGDAHRGEPVRCTRVGRSTHSVVIGPKPPEVKWEERHGSSNMRMVSPDRLRAHLGSQASEWQKWRGGPSTDTALRCRLQAAITPWIGHLLIPTQTRPLVADTLRECGEKTQARSTPVFQLLLQAAHVDTAGCRDVIEQRKREGVSTPSSIRTKDPRTVAGILQQRARRLQSIRPQHSHQMPSSASQSLPGLFIHPAGQPQKPVAPPSPSSSASVPLSQSVRGAWPTPCNPAVPVGSSLANQLAPCMLLMLAPPPVSLLSDHDYCGDSRLPSPPVLVPKQPDPCDSEPQAPPTDRGQGRKRRRWQEQDGVSSGQVVQVSGGTGDPGAKARPGAAPARKRVQKLSLKARELQEAAAAEDAARQSRPRASRCKAPAVAQLPRLFPAQPVWMVTPGGLVQLAQPQQLAPPLTFKPAPHVPISLPAPPTRPSDPLQPGPSSYPPPPLNMVLPSQGVVKGRAEALQFNPSLMFLEPQEAVRDWLSGRRGVAAPGAGMALPYLPPFVSTLSTLGALLQARRALAKSSLQLLREDIEPRRCRDKTQGAQPAGPSVDPDVPEQEEEEVLVRELVAERFSSNPAYQLLKARFLSLFTVPALLATIHPITEQTVAPPPTQEEEVEEEEEELLTKTKERRRQRAQGSVLMTSGAPANHFSGIRPPAAD